MKVVILCGGKGTRIRGISDELPKPMIPIGEYPIVKHIMDIYSRHNYNDFILCLGYKGWKIKEYFLNYRTKTMDVAMDFTNGQKVKCINSKEPPPWKITLAETGLESMTGYRIKLVQKYIGNERFMLTYGDGVGNINITALMEFHKSHGKLATITSVRPPSRFGELVVNGNIVSSFEEKSQSLGGLINGGFFVCEPGVFEYLADNESCTFECDPLVDLARDGELMTFFHNGFWMPMDTYREYKMLNDMWNRGNARWCQKPLREQLLSMRRNMLNTATAVH